MKRGDYIILNIIIFSSLILFVAIQYVQSCNELVCASQVSKCLITQSCRCDMKNCSCCRECRQCLSYLYVDCCDCIDMCPKPNDTRNELSKQSYTEELEGIPGLFSAVTEGTDINYNWRVFTFPVDYDAALYGGKLEKDIKYMLHSTDQELDAKAKERENIVTVNCTVVYMSQCMSNVKCKESCESMGASSYRWFHDGCCECVGSTCINFGINDSRCLACPELKDAFSATDWDDEIPMDQLEYGETMNSMDMNDEKF